MSIKPSQVEFLLISQKVKDIKVPPNPKLDIEIAKLRRGLRKHGFIKTEKVPVDLLPLRVEPDGLFVAEIPGDQLSSDLDLRIQAKFPLKLEAYTGPMDVESIFSAVADSRIDDGGNVQNMALNLLQALAHESMRKRLIENHCNVSATIACSSDLLERMEGNTASEVQEIITQYRLDIADRFSIQVHWEDEGNDGTLAITSQPRETGNSTEKLINENANFREAFMNASCFISSDSLHHIIDRYGKPPYSYHINASSAFRGLVAQVSFGKTTLLPMNNSEAADVSLQLMQRKYGAELSSLTRPPFPSPFCANGKDIDMGALRLLDDSLDQFRTCIPLYRRHDRTGIACPITFGQDGGLVVGSREEIVCFTTTVHPDKEMELLEQFGNSDYTSLDRKFEVGAGDSSATIIALFDSVDPQIFISPFMEDRERKDRMLEDLSTTIFISTLSRISGSFLLHTEHTNWRNIRMEAFVQLFDEVARESLGVARSVRQRFSHQSSSLGTIDRWGIEVLMWRLGKIAFPERQ